MLYSSPAFLGRSLENIKRSQHKAVSQAKSPSIYLPAKLQRRGEYPATPTLIKTGFSYGFYTFLIPKVPTRQQHEIHEVKETYA